WEERREFRDPTFLRHAASDPVDRLIAGERLRRRVGVGRLRVVDETHARNGRDRLLPVFEAGEARDPRDDIGAGKPQRTRRGIGGGGILPIVPPREERHVFQIHHFFGASSYIVKQTA